LVGVSLKKKKMGYLSSTIVFEGKKKTSIPQRGEGNRGTLIKADRKKGLKKKEVAGIVQGGKGTPTKQASIETRRLG